MGRGERSKGKVREGEEKEMVKRERAEGELRVRGC